MKRLLVSLAKRLGWRPKRQQKLWGMRWGKVTALLKLVLKDQCPEQALVLTNPKAGKRSVLVVALTRDGMWFSGSLPN